MKNFSYSLLVLVLFMFLASGTSAQNISARFTTSVYNWQYQSEDANGNLIDNTHLRLHQGVRLRLGNLSSSGAFLQTYFSASTDLGSNISRDPLLRLYNFYFKIPGLFSGLDLQVGRQRIYAGVGWGTIDGLYLKYNFSSYLLEAYAGAQMPLETGKLAESWGDSRMYGFRLRPPRFYGIRSSLSFVSREREAREYSEPGRWSGVLQKTGSTQRRLLGLDIQRTSFGKLDSYIRLDLALLNGFEGEFELNRFESVNTLNLLENLSVGLDYILREPLINLNSIFWVFDYEPSTEIAGRITYSFIPDLQATLRYASVDYGDDTSERLGLSLAYKSLFFTYTNNAGYSGNLDGVAAGYRRPLNESFTANAQLAYSWYEFAGDSENRNNALAALLSVNWAAAKNMRVDLQGQFLNNLQYSSDYRFFLRYSYRLFSKL